MISFLLSLINPVKAIANEIAKYKTAAVNAETEQKRIEAEENIVALEAQRDVLLKEQDNFFTRSVRPMWTYPFIIYTWKIVVWDKVLGWGVTDPLDEKMWWLAMVMASAYFVSRMRIFR